LLEPVMVMSMALVFGPGEFTATRTSN
jgi:hypothetical protein